MVSRRKAKKIEKKQLKTQGMSIDDAYKILDNAPSLVSKSVYEEALKLVEAEDAGFAAEIRAFNEAKKKEDALRAAYQIVGGYQHTVSKNVYANAMKLIEADDPEFAKKLQTLFENGTNFKDATSEQLATAEQIEQNAQTIEHEYTNNDAQLRKDVINDDMRQIIDNTIVPDMTDEDKETVLLKTGMQEVIPEIAENTEFAEAKPKEKHNMLVSRIRDSIKRTLFRARLSSAEKPRDAFDFSKKFKVTTKSITDAYETAYKRTTSFINRLAVAGHKKAAIWFNKAKTKAHRAMVTIATTSVLLSSLLPSCNNSNSTNDNTPVPAEKTVVLNDTTKTSQNIVSDMVRNDSVQVLDVAMQTTANDSISVPTSWNADMGISEAQWNRLQSFWGSRDKLEQFYKKITNDMLGQDGIFANKTREQVLFQYERMSSWNLPKHQETIEAFDAFFGDCNGTITKEQALQLDDVLSDGSIKDVQGTFATRATGRDVDCEEGSKLHVQNLNKQDTTNPTTFTMEEKSGSSVVVGENNPEFTVTERGGSSQTIYLKSDTVPSAIDVLKGNSLNDGKQVGTIDASDIVDRNVTGNNRILVEDKESNVCNNASEDIVTNDSNRTNTISPDSLVNTQTSVTTDSVSATRATFNFGRETGSSTVVSDNTAASDSVQIVADSEDLPRGTPAAGNVPERGGYENSGLISKTQDRNLQNWYVTKYGDNAFEDVMEKMTDDMLAKGGAFEGLSQKQALRVAEAIMVHANLFPESTEALEAFLNPCKNAQLTAEQIEQIRKDGYNITEEGLVTDGVYNKGVWARFYKTGDCEEDGHVVYEKVDGQVKTTTASNQYFGRLYMYKPTRPEPIALTVEELQGDSKVVHIKKDTVPRVTLYKGNNLDISKSKQSGAVSANDIVNREVNNKENILVENDSLPAMFTFNEVKGKAITKVIDDEKVEPSETNADKRKEAKTPGKDKKDGEKKSKKNKKCGKKNKKDNTYYDNLTPEQKAARLEAARRLVERGY